MCICMPEEDIKEVKKDDRPSFLKEAREEREKLEKLKEELTTLKEDIRAMKEEEILSGKAPQPKEEVKPEENPVDYLKRVLENKL